MDREKKEMNRMRKAGVNINNISSLSMKSWKNNIPNKEKSKSFHKENKEKVKRKMKKRVRA